MKMKNFIKNIIVDDYTRRWYSKVCGIENVSVQTHVMFNVITLLVAVTAYEYGVHQDKIEGWYSDVSQKITWKLEDLLAK